MKRIIWMLVACLMIVAIPASASADSEITVTGMGEVLVPADVAVVSLGVTSTDREVLAAQAKTNEAIAAIRTTLADSGIPEQDISTGYINIYARYDYTGEMEELVAYNANATLAIRVSEIERAGEVIDAAFEAGANTLDGISFFASDTDAAEEIALRAAVEDAKGKAEILAEASGLHIRGVEDIVEQSTYSYDGGFMNNFSMKQMDSAAGTVVQAAKLTVCSSVTVTFKAG